MTTNPQCPRCGKPVTTDAPEGLCAACLIAASMATVSGSVDASASAASGGGAPRLTAGQSWGPYRIGRLLGRGGMGEVYEAESLETGRRLALKLLRSRLEKADDRARFLREGQLAASISHPHTVYIFGSEEISGTPAISMELLPGGTLKDRVAATGPLPPTDAVAAVLDIIGGLDAAQAAGILHRDIKPSNCFVDSDGSVKVGDFGLSISTLARDVRGDIVPEGFEGTPQFAAPEQLRGEPLDVRADIYAVGATLYYLLTGRPPFDAGDLQQLFNRVINEPAPSPRTLRTEVPRGLAGIVIQCLSKSPGDRPASYAVLADALRPYAPHEEAPARPGLRLVAGIIDGVVISLIGSVWKVSQLDIAYGPGQPATAGATWWALIAMLAYYIGLEGFFRASLGKRA